MNKRYVTAISDGRWIAYDLPGNAGWILYFVCCYRLIRETADLFSLTALLPALVMLVGIIELISERIARLDRILPRYRLLRGFGALTLGGMLGAIWGGIGMGIGRDGAWLMLIGGSLCAVFASLLYGGYHHEGEDIR